MDIYTYTHTGISDKEERDALSVQLLFIRARMANRTNCEPLWPSGKAFGW